MNWLLEQQTRRQTAAVADIGVSATDGSSEQQTSNEKQKSRDHSFVITASDLLKQSRDGGI
nr:hypothetical protein [Microbispora rosea]